LVGERIYYIFVIMRRVIWEFLNTRYKGVEIYHEVHDLDNRRTEKFITKCHESIMQITYFYSGKEIRTHMSLHIRRDVRNYFDMDYLDVEGIVLDWCRDKSVETIEM